MASSGEYRWDSYNQLSLTLSGDSNCEPAEQHQLAVRTLGLEDGIWLDDGSLHQVTVRYTHPRVVVHIDGRFVLSAALELVEGAAATAARVVVDNALMHGGADSIAPLEVPVLDTDGRAFIGFTAASGLVGFEQYELSGWTFRRDFAFR